MPFGSIAERRRVLACGQALGRLLASGLDGDFAKYPRRQPYTLPYYSFFKGTARAMILF